MKIKCSICLKEESQNWCKLVDCLHEFCIKCIEKFHEKRDICPLCKKKISKLILLDSRKRDNFDIGDVFKSGINLDDFELESCYRSRNNKGQKTILMHLKRIENIIFPCYNRPEELGSCILTTKLPKTQPQSKQDKVTEEFKFTRICKSCCTYPKKLEKKKKKYFNKEIVFLKSRKYNKAIKIFNDCVLNEKFKKVFFWRGRTFYYQKKFLLALNDFKYNVCINPEDSIGYFFLCKCLMKTLDIGDGYIHFDYYRNLNYFDTVIKLYPKKEILYYWYAQYILRYTRNIGYYMDFVIDQINYTNSLSLIKKAIILDRCNCLFYKLRGIIYLNLRDYDKALIDLLYSNELFKKFGMYKKSLNGKKCVIVEKTENLHLGYVKIANCYIIKKKYLLFIKYLNVATNCKCKSCNSKVNFKLKLELNVIKVQVVDKWKTQIFQKNVRKW